MHKINIVYVSTEHVSEEVNVIVTRSVCVYIYIFIYTNYKKLIKLIDMQFFSLFQTDT